MSDFTSTRDFIDVNNAQVNIFNVSLSFDCLHEKTRMPIGTARCKVLKFNVVTDEVLEGASFIYHAITEIDGNGTDTVVGRFTVIDAVKTNGIYRVEALDELCEANILYTSALNFSTADIDVILAEICTNCGLTLDSTTSLVNGAYVIGENPFTSGENSKEVIAYIAGINGCFAYMRYDDDYGNLLTFKTPDITADAVCEARPDKYTELQTHKQTLAIDTVVIRDKLSGESTTAGDELLGKLVIDDNPIAVDSTA